MKIFIVLLAFIISPLFGIAQTVTLQECYKMGRDNHPSLAKLDLFEALSKDKVSNLGVNHLPKLDLTGQASYQSDVPGVLLPPNNIGFSIPEISKDWYKAYVDIQQNIYDGGMVRHNKKLENAILEADLSEIEISLYQVNQMINAAYFSSLFFRNGMEAISLKEEVLTEQSKTIQSAVENGVVLPNELDNIKAEIILSKQQKQKIETQLQNSFTTLSVLTGQKIAADSELLLPDIAIDTFETDISSRPEITFFSAKRNQLELSKEVYESKRLPKVFGFAQVGYGRPGLNPLDDSFTDWYLVGIGLKWNIWDWKETSRKKHMASINQQIIETGQVAFEQNQTIQLLTELNNIEQFESLIASDKELFDLRQKIAGRSKSQLENGTITSADFIRDLNNAINAKLGMESRMIELAWAKMNLLFITGIDITE